MFVLFHFIRNRIIILYRYLHAMSTIIYKIYIYIYYTHHVIITLFSSCCSINVNLDETRARCSEVLTLTTTCCISRTHCRHLRTYNIRNDLRRIFVPIYVAAHGVWLAKCPWGSWCGNKRTYGSANILSAMYFIIITQLATRVFFLFSFSFFSFLLLLFFMR